MKKPFYDDSSASVPDSSGMLMFCSLLAWYVVVTLVSHDSGMHDNIVLFYSLIIEYVATPVSNVSCTSSSGSGLCVVNSSVNLM